MKSRDLHCVDAHDTLDGWMDGWMDGWVDGWMGGWVDGWMQRRLGEGANGWMSE